MTRLAALHTYGGQWFKKFLELNLIARGQVSWTPQFLLISLFGIYSHRGAQLD